MDNSEKNAYRIGLKPWEFWKLTPKELSMMIDAYLENQESLDFRAGLICSVIAEVNRDRKKRSRRFKPSDFMPVYKNRKKEIRQEQDPKNQARMLKALTLAMGGTVIE